MTAPHHEAGTTMHVLYLIDSLAASGGAEQSLATLAPAYRDLGVRLDVGYLHERDGLNGQLAAAGAELFPLGGTGGRAGWLTRTRTLIRTRRPDLVHTTLFEADLVGRVAARATRTPVVSSLVSASYGPEHHADPRVRSWKLRAAQTLDAATARLATRFHAVSETVADTMATRLRVPRDRIDVIPRGRDPQALGEPSGERRAAARATLGVAEDQPLVLAVGRQEHDKGFDLLVEAIALVRSRLPDVKVLVVGSEGSRTPALLDLVQERGIDDTVSFLGVRHDVPALLCAADAFVCSSRREGFPGAVLEAMALGAPIIASDLPQVREAVDETCAWLAQAESVDALAEGIARVLVEPTEARERAALARDRFLREFNIEIIAARMLTFYRRALGRDT